MERNEFNLSVLENATNFSSPLDDFANYETIFSMIKEEIDISTEDETASTGSGYQRRNKGGKSPAYLVRAGRRKESESEQVFKSPYKKRYSLNKLTSPANRTIKRDSHEEGTSCDASLKRTTSHLGTIKRGRSFSANCKNSVNHRTRKSVSQSSDTLDRLSDNEQHSAIARIILENGNNHVHCNNVEDDILEIVKNARERDSSIEDSLDVDDPRDTASDVDFVESSQATTCTDLRQRLLGRRSTIATDRKSKTITDTVKNDLQRNFAQSEEEEQDSNFILTLSPSSKSIASVRETSPIVRTSRKRKSTSPSKISMPKQQKFNGTHETIAETSPRSRKSRFGSQPSPLEGLTQELENCITNSDYEQMSEDIETDILERTSFTFETIELLNEYDHANSRVNNQILSKILTSPMKKIKKEPGGSLENIAFCPQPNEDPLYIEENETNVEPSSVTDKQVKTKMRVKSERKSTSRKSQRKSCFEETIEAIVATPEIKESTATEKNIKSAEDNEQRVGGRRLREKKKDDLKDDENLALEAARVSKKVDAAQRKAALSEEIRQKLDNLVICLRHRVLPQHEIETRAGSATLSYEQQKEFIKLAPLNKETYSPAEDDVIRENWKAFCHNHDWDPEDYKPFLRLKHGRRLIMSSLEERRKFVQFLADGLPNRPLYSVYSRFKILYANCAAAGSRYTRNEDTKILAHMLHNPAEAPDKKCSELAKILDRSRVSIWKRYKKLKAKRNREEEKEVSSKVEWNLQLTQDFITTLLDVTLSEELIELKDAFIPKVVWLKMQEKMDINHELMKRFWEQQLHLQLFSPEPLYMNQIKITLIQHMYEKEIHHPTEIKWNDVARRFDGFTVSFLRKVFNHLTAAASTTLRSRNLTRILKWLYKKQIQHLKNKPKDKCLPRITYENKQVQILPEDLERIGTSVYDSESD